MITSLASYIASLTMDIENLFQFLEKTRHLVNTCRSVLSCFFQSICTFVSTTFHLIISNVNLFWFHLYYYILLSLIGYVALRFSNSRTTLAPNALDLFFTSVSSATISSNSTVEMEAFSNIQLVIIAMLMFCGGEMFTSIIGLQIMRLKLINNNGLPNKVELAAGSIESDSHHEHANHLNQIELGIVNTLQPDYDQQVNKELKYRSLKVLSYVMLIYLLTSIAICSILIFSYVSRVPSAREVLDIKGIKIGTFCAFTGISTFVNGGFIPTNENMMAFVKNSGLLLLLIPYLLVGSTLFGPCLFLVIWGLNRITKREEFDYLLKYNRQIGCGHVFSRRRALLVLITSLGLIVAQYILFSTLEWYSGTMESLSSYQRVVGSLFQVVNSRHAGESVFDFSLISPTILVLFIIMMYLPPYVTVFPVRDNVKGQINIRVGTNQRKKHTDRILLSHVAYLAVVIIIVSIIERHQMREDPLNFSFLNIALEVVSAYGNVGFTAGYRCNRRLNTKNYCKDTSYGFVGRWSWKGKLVLIFVMFFGRLKSFRKSGKTAWILSYN